MDAGIAHIEVYVPRGYVSQAAAEAADGCPGKYTRGLGQRAMAVLDGQEDAQSMALTALSRLLAATGVAPGEIGRLDAATESGPDAMKTLATVLVGLLGGGDVEAATHAGACHGGTLALFAAVAWVQSEAWDGRKAVVVASDAAVYGPGPARATGGAGAVALLVEPRAPLVLEPFRVSRSAHLYDVHRPHAEPFPKICGAASVASYLESLRACAPAFDAGAFAAAVFHTPYARLAEKAWGVVAEAHSGAGLPAFEAAVEPSLALARECGNLWTASLYAALFSSLAQSPPDRGGRILAFSYGSGRACSLFSFRAEGPVGGATPAALAALLAGRVEVSPGAGGAFPFAPPEGAYRLLPGGATGPAALQYWDGAGALPLAPAVDGGRASPPSDFRAGGLAAVAHERWHRAGASLSAAEREALRGLGVRGGLEYGEVRGRCAEAVVGCVSLPVGVAGPLLVDGVPCHVPLATLEGGLVASTRRGCKALTRCGGAVARVLRREMVRAPVFRCEGVAAAAAAHEWLSGAEAAALASRAVAASSRHARFARMAPHLVGRHLHLRLSLSTGDAMGMNMATLAAQEVVRALGAAEGAPPLGELLSLSGNLCADKKAAAVTFLEGRGRSVVVEGRLDPETVAEVLKTSPRALCRLGAAKNLAGSAAAGAQAGGFNAHAANVVAAVYLATGQDAAQVVNGGACLTFLEEEDDGGLYASCTLPALELGCVGGGAHLGGQAACRQLLLGGGAAGGEGGCDRFAAVLASAVLAAELSLLAALCSGDLVSAHLRLNRAKKGAPGAPAPPPGKAQTNGRALLPGEE